MILDILFLAKGKGKGEEDDKEGQPGGDSIIPTLPDVKMCAAKAIARCARSSKFLNCSLKLALFLDSKSRI